MVVVGLAVAVPVVAHLALPAPTVFGAVVVGVVAVLHLVLHSVVGQGERGWRLLARPSEFEIVVGNMAAAPVILLVQVDVDVDVARVVVSLQVERLRHRLGRGIELEGHVVVVAAGHFLADVGRYL